MKIRDTTTLSEMVDEVEVVTMEIGIVMTTMILLVLMITIRCC
jgi:hypothetical protein